MNEKIKEYTSYLKQWRKLNGELSLKFRERDEFVKLMCVKFPDKNMSDATLYNELSGLIVSDLLAEE